MRQAAVLGSGPQLGADREGSVNCKQDWSAQVAAAAAGDVPASLEKPQSAEGEWVMSLSEQ